MALKKLLLASFLLSGSLHAQNSLGIDINNDDAEILASLNLNTLADYSDGTAYMLDVNYLRIDEDNYASVGISGQNTLQGVEGFTLAFGLKGVFASNFMAFPLMTKGIYILPLNDNIPTTSVTLGAAYAPSVLSFRDAESYSELRLEVGMEIISNIHIFTGYRNIKTEYETNNKTFNNSFYGGMKLSF